MPGKRSHLNPVKPYHYLDATGSIPYNMTNDYIFRIVLQENPLALKGLVCALLHKKKHDIRSIRILNPIFPDHPVFYATYRMMDVRDHYLYSDKYTISVVELGQIELATDEDRHYQIDQWVRLMKASTWDTRIT